MADPSSKTRSQAGAEPLESPGLLQRSDQFLLAGLVIVAASAALFWWVRQGGICGGLVRWEQGELREARFLVDVNTASWPELSQLPRIGETLARRIIAHREEHGPFCCPDDLMKVRGIGPKTVDLLRPFLDPESWPDESFPEALIDPAGPGVE